MTRRRIVPILVLIITLHVLVVPVSVLSYGTGNKWPNTSLLVYQIDPNLDTNLTVSGAAGDVTSAAADWYDSSALIVGQSINGYDVNRTGAITAVDYQGTNECAPHFPGYNLIDNVPGYTCVPNYAGTPNNDFMRIVLNSSPTYRWNRSGVQDNTHIPNDVDVRTVVEHELGHTVSLFHNLPQYLEAVMFYDTKQAKQSLWEDDKRGATQLYGAYTGFDGLKAQGIQYTRAADHTAYNTYKARVTNWFNEPNTDTLMVNAGREQVNGVWVNPRYGDRMMRLEGGASSTFSYVYFKLFSVLDDYGGRNIGTTIVNGTRLKWCQYNFQQSTFSVDMYFSDGTALRDYANIVDQNGVRVGPAYRGNYPTGQWLCFDVDLSPLAGKTVQNWYLGYDNRYTGIGYQFRAAFDSIRYT